MRSTLRLVSAQMTSFIDDAAFNCGRTNGLSIDSIIANLDQLPKRIVPLESLVTGGSARLSGNNREHVNALMEVSEGLPPIVVHRSTMRIIDGEHRAQAARRRGEREIEVRLFDGDELAAFILSVRANITHGLPLTLTDRTVAAARILSLRSEWSDRAIAQLAGLSAATVGAIRRSTVHSEQLTTRLGRDGRRRPANAAAGRTQASELITKKPHASLREIANEVGMSIATVRDVRQRMAQGLNPVPPSQRRSLEMDSYGDGDLEADGSACRKRTALRPPTTILDRLRKDPSLRSTEAGRIFLKWLSMHVTSVNGYQQFIDQLPSHSLILMREVAHGLAHVWEDLANELETRANPS